MRQLIVQVPRGRGGDALRIAERHEGVNLALLDGRSPEGDVDILIAHVSNARVGSLVDELQQAGEVRVSMFPQGVVALRPPAEDTPNQVTNVEPRSPLEVFLSALQSVGSWKGLLGYALVAGVVVWIGLFTNTSFLLVAAMLIAPFAGPAITAAIATARGDHRLLLRSVGRYAASLAVTIAAAAALTFAFRQRIATPLMVDVSQVSTAAVLLPLAAGIAGGVHLSQSERSSLVSGAGVGILVAASLAPPAGIVGMAAALGEWDMVKSASFLLALQLVGINAAGALTFRAFGLKSEGPRYPRGRRAAVATALAASTLLIVGLLAWQFADEPDLQRSTLAQRAASDVRDVVEESGLARLVDADVRFTRADVQGQNTLLAVVHVQRASGVDAPADEIRGELTRRIQERLNAADYGATPLVDVTVLEPPG